MQPIIRIGTRDSQLALWQATRVQDLLAAEGFAAELVPIKSEGDIDLVTPLYAMGVQGIFTRSLDIALLKNQIDLAVHSMKDVPVQLPAGLQQAAVLARHNPADLLVFKDAAGGLEHKTRGAVVASSSLRRKAQWLHRYPEDRIEPLRGNVNTRLKKLAGSQWFGAIFASAGLDRIGIRPAHSVELDWMIPAPAQGAIMIVCRQEDEAVIEATAGLNDENTARCTAIERQFLADLMGGCSTPIGALATIRQDQINFAGNLLSNDGAKQLTVNKTVSLTQADNLARLCAEEILQQGGRKLLEEPAHV